MSANSPRRGPLATMARALAAALLVAYCGASLAQSRAAAAPQKQVEAPTPQDVHPPYEPQLLRLAEIIGALAYLRDLCGEQDGDKWRAKMAALLAAEGTSDNERERLAGAYNHGFQGYALTYHSCTPNARIVIARYLDEGERLAHDVESHYGGS